MNVRKRKQTLKKSFIEKRGYWDAFWEGLLDLDPDFFENYLAFSAIPWTQGPLVPKVKELIYTAIDVSTTHLYEPGLRVHLENALKHGATPEEIMEVYRLCSSIGTETNLLGANILLEELERRGVVVPENRDDAQREAFVDAFGYWDASSAAWQRLDPESFSMALNIWRRRDDSVLDQKTSAFIMIAVTTATTYLNEYAARAHIRQALDHGATKEEILEVLQLASVLGMHSCTFGVPVLVTEMSRRATSPSSAS